MIPILQVDIGDVTGIIALIVSGFAIYISHFYSSRREQIKTSRYMWERINVEFDKIREKSKAKQRDPQSGHIIISQDILWSVVREIDYFAYLILVGEIKDKHVLGYYKTPFSQYIESILNNYTSPDHRYYLYLDYEYFRELVKKWDVNRPDEEVP